MIATKQVYLSYVHADEDWAEEFADDLAERGLEVWRDSEALSDEKRVAAAERALRDADTVVVLVSKESARNPNVLFEIGAAIGGGKRLLPVFLTDPRKTKVPFLSAEDEAVCDKSPHEAARAVADAL